MDEHVQIILLNISRVQRFNLKHERAASTRKVDSRNSSPSAIYDPRRETYEILGQIPKLKRYRCQRPKNLHSHEQPEASQVSPQLQTRILVNLDVRLCRANVASLPFRT